MSKEHVGLNVVAAPPENADSRTTESVPDKHHPASILKRVLALNERLPLLVVLAWALLYATRPFYLGLYSDDWSVFVETAHGSAPFSIDRLVNFVGTSSVYVARPVAGLVAFLINSIAGESAVMYQLCAALLVLGAALSLRAWFATLFSHATSSGTIPADLATVFWLSLPWSLATTGWVVCAASALPAQIFFTEAARFVARQERFETRWLWGLAALLVACNFSYEGFYFQFLFVAAFHLVVHRQMFAKRAHIFWFLGTVIASQMFAILVNRFAAHLTPAYSKTFNVNWWATLRTTWQLTPGELPITLGFAGALWVKLIWIFVAISLISLALGLARTAERKAAAQCVGLVGLGAIAILVTDMIYALTFYRLSPVGFMGRTLTSVSWGLSVVFFGLMSTTLSSKPRVLRVTAMTAVILIIVLNSMALCTHAYELAFVWSGKGKC